MDAFTAKLALIGVLGAAAQWIAWRLRLPAIVLLLAAGFVAGPVLGVLDPVEDFGTLLRPLVGVAVALILFEGGLTLNFAELKDASRAVRRLVLIGTPVAFLLGSLAARYLAGLTWPTALLLGAILVVTGPTVVIPLLRHVRLTSRAASLLRWEAILVDSVGALLAVVVFECVLVYNQALTANQLLIQVGGALLWAVAGGYGLGRLLVLGFVRGQVPEYLKAPLVVATVIGTYAVSDALLEESGLLAVTILGLTLGNAQLASLAELKRFKEFVSILLVSGVFVMLTATLNPSEFLELMPRHALFLLALLFVVRPASVLLATIGTDVPIKERLLAAWIAPRGVVAVAVSGLFAVTLAEQGVPDASMLVALTFAVVVITVVLHGFTITPLANLLGLSAQGNQGVLVLGGSRWSTAFAQALQAMEVPVMIVDRNWSHLREPRYLGVEVFYGELLSERAHREVGLNRFDYLIAATDNDDYNALVCTDFGPEFGRSDVFQIGRPKRDDEGRGMAVTLGGRPFLPAINGIRELNDRIRDGWSFRRTTLTEDYDEASLRAGLSRNGDDHGLLLLARRGERIVWLTGTEPPSLAEGDEVLSFGPEDEPGR